jgi:hypothetical protein
MFGFDILAQLSKSDRISYNIADVFKYIARQSYSPRLKGRWISCNVFSTATRKSEIGTHPI